MLTMKSLFPQTSLWSFGMVAFPALKILSAVPSLGLYNQLFANWRFLMFCFFATVSYCYYCFAAPAFQAHRGADPAPALEQFDWWKKRVHYPWLLCELSFLLAFLWPLLSIAVQVLRNGQLDAAVEDFATRYLAHHWATLLWDLFELVLLYLASVLLTQVVLVDALHRTVLFRTADGMYTDAAQLVDLAALCGPRSAGADKVADVQLQIVSTTSDEKAKA